MKNKYGYENLYEMFKNKGFSKKEQEAIENFARCGTMYTEADEQYWFRAGFLIKGCILKKEYVVVHKEDLNLNWYRETKAMIENGG